MIIFQLPLGVLGLSIPFVAMTAAIHRSNQTADQIAAQREQNNFANHFKHLEEFKKSINESSVNVSYWRSIEHLHKLIYPNTLQGDLKPLYLDDYCIQYVKEYVNALKGSNGSYVSVITSHYAKKIADELDLDITWPKRVKPSDLWSLFFSIEKAYSFSGLHESPFVLNKELTPTISNYTALDDMVENLYCNFNQLVRSFDSDIVNDETLEQSISALSGGSIRHVKTAMRALWLSLSKEKRNELFDSATDDNQSWLEENVIAVLESQLSPETT